MDSERQLIELERPSSTTLATIERPFTIYGVRSLGEETEIGGTAEQCSAANITTTTITTTTTTTITKTKTTKTTIDISEVLSADADVLDEAAIEALKSCSNKFQYENFHNLFNHFSPAIDYFQSMSTISFLPESIQDFLSDDDGDFDDSQETMDHIKKLYVKLIGRTGSFMNMVFSLLKRDQPMLDVQYSKDFSLDLTKLICLRIVFMVQYIFDNFKVKRIQGFTPPYRHTDLGVCRDMSRYWVFLSPRETFSSNLEVYINTFLKLYDGNEDLNSFVENSSSDEISGLVNKLLDILKQGICYKNNFLKKKYQFTHYIIQGATYPIVHDAIMCIVVTTVFHSLCEFKIRKTKTMLYTTISNTRGMFGDMGLVLKLREKIKNSWDDGSVKKISHRK